MSSNIVTGAATSLSAASTVGATGTAVPIDRFTNAGTAWISTTGSPTVCTITNDVSFDGGVTWYFANTSAALNQTLFANTQNVTIAYGATHYRARVNTLSGGTAPTVTVQYVFRYESA